MSQNTKPAVEPNQNFLDGELKNKGITDTFTGSDTVNLISKTRWQPDNVLKVSDYQLFKKYLT